MNKVLEFAQKNGYKDVKFLGEWRGYKCYEPLSGDFDTFTGLPNIILEKDNKIRFSTSEEALETIDVFSTD